MPVTLSSIQPETVDFLWRTAIPAGHVTVLYGAAGVSKTTVALTIGTAVAAGGLNLLGHPATAGRVLFLDAELTGPIVASIVRRISDGFGVGVPEAFAYERLNGSIANEATRKRLRSSIGETADLLILDSFTAACLGADFMDVSQVGAVITFLRELAPTILVVDHTSKPQPGVPRSRTPYGSVAKEILARSLLLLEARAGSVSLTQTKSNFAEAMERVSFAIERSESAIRLIDGGDRADRVSSVAREYPFATDILRAIAAKPMKSADVAEAVGRNLKSVRNCLSMLRRSGAAQRDHSGLWNATAAPF